MTLPNFLIIGAMKAGTTTLYADLYDHPDIFLTSDKEPEGLRWCGSSAGVGRYKALFKRASDAKAVGEASTFYAKRPHAEGLADRARSVLGPDVQILYMVRDPLRRCVSQYHHEVVRGVESRPLNEALLAEPDYADFSRYDWQIAPWRAAFGEKNVHVLKFESYIEARMPTLQKVCGILNVDACKLQVETEKIFNASAGKRIARGPWRWILGSRFYRSNIRYLISRGVRDRLKLLLPRGPMDLERNLHPETEAKILTRLRPEDLEIWERAS